MDSNAQVQDAHDAVHVKKLKYDESTDYSDRCLVDFNGLRVKKILNENSSRKTLTVHAELAGTDMVVLLEKSPFDSAHVENYFTKNTTLKNTLKNDIYGTYEAYPPVIENAVKAVVIHPATEKHVTKYSHQEGYVIEETAQLYTAVTLPHLTEKQFSIQWVYNILEKKQEADRIVYEDPDPETGFILLPDMKWDRKDVNSLYLVAIVHRHGIKSLRDLGTNSLSLLRNIRDKGLDAIKEKFGVASHQLNVYLHYTPSYYHLHVHFTHVKLEAPGFGADRAHLLADVIQNIELMADYYQQKSLTFVVRENDELHKKYKDAGHFS